MPTFKATIRKQQLRRDGKYPVSIRVTHNRVSMYIPTGLYVSKKQVSKHYEIKDQFVLERTNQTIRDYERVILTIGTEEMRNMPVRAIAAILMRSKKRVDYSAYCRDLIAQDGRKWQELRNALAVAEDIGYKNIMLDEVDDTFLYKYRKELDSREVPSSIYTKGKDKGKPTKNATMKKLSATTKNKFLQVLSQVYKMIVMELGVAAKEMSLYNPFENMMYYKREAPKKGSIPVEDLRKIFSCEPSTKKRVLCRDLLKMSFCLGGMNIADLLLLTKENYDGSIIKYQRNKTKGRRADGAWTAIRVQPEIEPLVEKYKAKEGNMLFDFGIQWKMPETGRSMWTWTTWLCEEAKVQRYNPYLFRHTVATIARNKFGYSRDDVGMLLNHRGPMTVDDVYIDDDFSINDEMNRKILDYVFGEGM